MTVTAQGGQLINLYIDDKTQLALEKEKTKNSPSWTLTKRQLCDVELLLNGAFSPLQGFLTEADYNSVLSTMRLNDGTLWPMPITLDVTADFVALISNEKTLALRDPEGVLIATMEVTDCWKANKTYEADAFFTTLDQSHPGVHYLFNEANEYYLGGRLTGITPPFHYDFQEYRQSPAELRAYFEKNAWTNVIAFQTRNPVHRAHVIMMKRLMAEHQANVVIHTAVGLTKPGDIDHYSRVRCYKRILDYYPKNSALLRLLPLAMRMGGPKEALWQAIIRQNYGFSHFIVGRDHAGPGRSNRGGTFYDVKAAQQLVAEYQNELNIKILPAPFLLYSPDRGEFCEEHQLLEGEEGLYLSGAELRKILQKGGTIPSWFAYPSIIDELHITLPPYSKQGVTLFFTGLSGSGKSTLANGILVKFLEYGGRKATLLDGDVIRNMLSSELNFTKAHRDLNVLRIGYVASEITKNGGVAICAPIAPYARTRRKVRQMIEELGSFIEIHVSTPLNICESRDRKGLYAQARAGKIKGFTGIDDPYETPENPELCIDTSLYSTEEAVTKIWEKIIEIGIIQP
ncbi:MAG: bifunctional sulfate adenylyltransferase/adenylylsulfate kinase [Methylococcales bacterium]|nr:bifunctional sulfate adenylyltransferase/adenylylsulfate kinase [Methylococcales bacterium]